MKSKMQILILFTVKVFLISNRIKIIIYEYLFNDLFEKHLSYRKKKHIFYVFYLPYLMKLDLKIIKFHDDKYDFNIKQHFLCMINLGNYQFKCNYSFYIIQPKNI